MQTSRLITRIGVIIGTMTVAIAFSVSPAPAVARERGASATDGAVQHRLANATPAFGKPAWGDLTETQRAAISGQLLVGDAAAYARAKAAAQRAARTSAGTEQPGGSLAPATLRNFEGQTDGLHAPADQTGAIGTQRYVQLVNSRIGIYDRTNNTPISSDTLNTLVGAGSAPSVFDPQVMWDPDTNRFYYLTDQVNSATDNRLAFGFSTTASPNNATGDWCRYVISFGSEFPDYPKLGDFSGIIMMGVNVFVGQPFVRSDVLGVTKPPAGTTCPDASTFVVSTVNDVRNADASPSTTPLPANQVDPSSTGHVLAGKGFVGSNFISVFNVTKNASNQIVLGPPRTMSVPAFSVPPPAPQPGTARTLDTLDTRLTNAVSAIDPFRSNQVAIWTQHTVAGGAGAEVRWYEINPAPATPVPFQSGAQSNASLFLFNAAISPDRRRNGVTSQFGNGMVLHYSRSSSSQRVSIAAASKVDNGNVTGETLLKTSASVIDDFSCGGNVCRWGDYAGASPDPASATSDSHGVVWGTNGFAQANSGNFGDWRTQIFAVTAAPK